MEEEENTQVQGVATKFQTEGNGNANFFRGSDFDGEGQIVSVVSMERFTPADPKYGAKNEYGAGGVVTREHFFIKEGILSEGESFKYTFTQDDVQKVYENSSLSFYFAFKNLNPVPGQKITIKRNMKSQTEVEWTIA